jgi:hypothetical protein
LEADRRSSCLVAIDPFVPDSIYLDDAGQVALEVLTQTGVHSDGITDVAIFGCLACDNIVEIVNDDGEMFTRLFEQLNTQE